MEVNERFVILDDYSSLPINVGLLSFAISNNCKQLIVMNTIVLPTTGKGLTDKSNEFMNRCMLLCKYTTYSSIGYITFNLEWFGKVWHSKNRMVHNAVHRKHIADSSVSIQCQVASLQRRLEKLKLYLQNSAQSDHNSCRNQGKLLIL